jgi:hypothetical protein
MIVEESIECTLAQFEGLIKTTSVQVNAAGVEMEVEDLCQIFRITIYQAILKFSGDKSNGMNLRRFCFMCLTNRRKDLEGRHARRHNTSLDELREADVLSTGSPYPDTFDAKYLSIDRDQVYWEVEETELHLPDTLTLAEHTIARMRFDGSSWAEVDRSLGLSPKARQRAVRVLRLKLSEWTTTPRASAVRSAPEPDELPAPRAPVFQAA